MSIPTLVDDEVLAVLHAMQVVADHGWNKVIMESDCLQLISMLSESIRSLASFGAILNSCFGSFELF